MQQQHPAPAHPMGPMGAVPPTQITTEQIQKYLDENKQLILAILDNQNLGRLAECAQYQAQLQKNLLYLAAIADAQPQSPPMRPQMTPHATMPQPGGPFMQQVPIFPPKTPMHFTPQQIHELQQQQQLHHQPHMMPFQAHMGVRPVGGSNEMPSVAPQGMSETMPQRGSTPSSSVDAASEQADSQKKSMDAQPSENPKRPGETKTP